MRFCGCGRVPAYSNQPQHRSCAAAVSGPPNSEFAKIFELLNAFEQLDEQEQSAVLESAQSCQPPTRADGGHGRCHRIRARCRQYPCRPYRSGHGQADAIPISRLVPRSDYAFADPWPTVSVCAFVFINVSSWQAVRRRRTRKGQHALGSRPCCCDHSCRIQDDRHRY